jgi:hypothetical protein
MELLSLLLQLTAMVRFLHSPSIAILILVAFEVLESFKEIKIKRINRFLYKYRCLIIFNAASSVFLHVLV